MLDTERLDNQYADLDTQDTQQIVTALIQDQQRAAEAALEAAESLARAVDLAAQRLARGGRLLYAGAGTSGRLAQLDAAELPPTFSWPPERAVALLAGGRHAMWEAREGAEDDEQAARDDLTSVNITADDVLIAIAASGTTPYATAALHHARQTGALTIAIANNPGTPLLAHADIPVCLNTGPEVISGSTRLKAGTAQKIALNTLSSAIMIRLGKVYGNLMVDLKASNHKLRDRSVRLVVAATNCEPDRAHETLEASGWQASVAIVSVIRNVTVPEARSLLERTGGHVRAALHEPNPQP